LVLVFKTRVTGLSFKAFWQNRAKKRVAALGEVAHADGNGHVTSSERAKLIGLAAYARKAHFQFNNKTGVYLMTNAAEIPTFLQGTMKSWRRLFTIELDNNVGNLVKDAKKIHVEAVAGRRESALGENGEVGRDGGALDLRWIFKAGEQLLTDKEVRSLLKRARPRRYCRVWASWSCRRIRFRRSSPGAKMCKRRTVSLSSRLIWFFHCSTTTASN
jgi:hypothetical protein